MVCFFVTKMFVVSTKNVKSFESKEAVFASKEADK